MYVDMYVDIYVHKHICHTFTLKLFVNYMSFMALLRQLFHLYISKMTMSI